jgi:hypothetical protein
MPCRYRPCADSHTRYKSVNIGFDPVEVAIPSEQIGTLLARAILKSMRDGRIHETTVAPLAPVATCLLSE